MLLALLDLLFVNGGFSGAGTVPRQKKALLVR